MKIILVGVAYPTNNKFVGCHNKKVGKHCYNIYAGNGIVYFNAYHRVHGKNSQALYKKSLGHFLLNHPNHPTD